ncbi:MAG: Leucine carboxyl methyltransferase [Chloroflexi bacterium ADurb.Bin180]|mgnify:FL=1|nr:MAG: Leucine carboxyl methyltransferase [Chloroflexi bacterium ADurb.Bin180]
MTNKISLPAGVAQTNLITLYARALESQRDDALLRDERAVELVQGIDYDWTRIQLGEEDRVGLALRGLEMDRLCRDFMGRHPGGCAVHIGCGLDTRFWRVDDGQVLWYDLDLPQVIEGRRELIGGEQARYRMLASSVLDESWMHTLSCQQCGQVLFVAEGVLMYLQPQQVRWLVAMLARRFAGSELVCDAVTPCYRFVNNVKLRLSHSKGRTHWAIKRPEELESWGEGIRLLESYYYLDQDEPRLADHRWLIRLPFLAHRTGIFHYRLGEARESSGQPGGGAPVRDARGEP